MKLWNDDALRGVILGMIAGLLFLALTGSADTDLFVVHQQGVTPYGVLWTWLNPLYWTQVPYMISLFVIYAVVFKIQCVYVKRGKLDRRVPFLNLFSVLFLFALHAQQNVTVIMLGPFIALSPWMIIPIILQKIPFGWSWNFQDPHWNCAFNGTGNGYDAWTNPCLSNSVHADFFHIYSLSYILILFWVAYPLIIWFLNRHSSDWSVNGNRKYKPMNPEKKELVTQLLIAMLRDAYEEETAEKLGEFWYSTEGVPESTEDFWNSVEKE